MCLVYGILLLLVCKGLHEQQKVELLFFVQYHLRGSFMDVVIPVNLERTLTIEVIHSISSKYRG